MSKPEDTIEYPLPDLDNPKESPSYSTVLEWMRTTKGRRVTFDFWARGNYMRRLLQNRAQGVEPVLVRVSDPREMSWAYKRLALLDIPVEFVFAGQCSKAKVVHLCPDDIVFDAGWGYIGGLGSRTRINGRGFFPIIGNAKLMPEPVLDWLVEEAADEFLAGRVFVAPAELIGIDQKADPVDLAKISELSGGTPVTSQADEAKAILEIGIPYLDGLSLENYRKLLKDYGDHLEPFRKSFASYVVARNKGETQAKEAAARLCSEIQELTKSDTHIHFRDAIAVIGGILGLTSAVLAAIHGEPSAIMAATGAAMTSAKGAIATHEQLRKKAKEKKTKIHASPHALMWKLGMTKQSRFNSARNVQVCTPPRQNPGAFNDNADYHWLCPPTNGLMQLAVRE